MRRRKLNLPLIEVIVVSVVIHLIAIFVLGGLTVWQIVHDSESEFEAPEIPAQSIEPQQIKVQIKESESSKLTSTTSHQSNGGKRFESTRP